MQKEQYTQNYAVIDAHCICQQRVKTKSLFSFNKSFNAQSDYSPNNLQDNNQLANIWLVNNAIMNQTSFI